MNDEAAPSGQMPSAAAGQLVTALRCRPWPLVWEPLRLAVLFSAKAGCTFVVKWFFAQAGLLEAAAAHGPWIHDYRTEVFYRSEHYRAGALLEPGMRILKFVREPYERAVSSYIHALRSGYDDGKLEPFLGRPLDRQHRFSFREFVAYLGSDSLTALRCNPHHRCQVHRLERLGRVEPTQVVRIEDAQDVLSQLEQQLGLVHTESAVLRRSGHHTQRSTQAEPCTDRSSWARAGGRPGSQFPATHFFYDEELLQQVRKLYRHDFAPYGYDPADVPGPVEG